MGGGFPGDLLIPRPGAELGGVGRRGKVVFPLLTKSRFTGKNRMGMEVHHGDGVSWSRAGDGMPPP